MTREILFRGKRMDNGEWVDGYLLKTQNGTYVMYSGQWDDDLFISPRNIIHSVNPDTVGQYTGLTDKHGKRIFEGDIVRISKTLFAVEWRGAEFVFGHIAGQPWSYPYFASHAESCEIIGNIHDNPELIGGEE